MIRFKLALVGTQRLQITCPWTLQPFDHLASQKPAEVLKLIHKFFVLKDEIGATGFRGEFRSGATPKSGS